MADWVTTLDDTIRRAHGAIEGGAAQDDDFEAIRALAPQMVARLDELDARLANPDAGVREATARLLGAFALGGHHAGWVLDALEAPARVATARLTPALASCAAYDPSAAVRRAALRALLAQRTEEVGAAMSTHLADDDRQVQDLALTWLARRGDPRGAPRLLERLAGDQCDATSIDQVRMIGIPAAAPLLARWLRDPDPVVRHAAAVAAAEHVGDPAIPAAVADELVAALTAALAHRDSGALEAAIALAQRPHAAVPEMRALLSAPRPSLSTSQHDRLDDALRFALAAAGEHDVLARLDPPWTRERLAAIGLVDDARAHAALGAAVREAPWYLAEVAALVCRDAGVLRERLAAPEPLPDDVRARTQDASVRRNAWLALAAIDPSIPPPQDRWDLSLDDFFDGDGLALAIAVARFTARRSPAELGPLRDQLAAALDDAVLLYRGRGHVGPLARGYLFYVRRRGAP